MTTNESKQKADLIWSKLFSKESQNRTKQEQLNTIEAIVIQIAQEQINVGRNQVLNHIDCEVKGLRDY